MTWLVARAARFVSAESGCHATFSGEWRFRSGKLETPAVPLAEAYDETVMTAFGKRASKLFK